MSRGPWTDEDLLRWLATTVLAAGLCSIAWWYAADQAPLGDQIPFANLSVAGLVLGSYAHAALFLRGRRAIGARRRLLLDASLARPVVREISAPDGFGLVAGDGLGRYHRTECPLAAGRGWSTAARADHDAAGRRACGVCRP